MKSKMSIYIFSLCLFWWKDLFVFLSSEVADWFKDASSGSHWTCVSLANGIFQILILPNVSFCCCVGFTGGISPDWMLESPWIWIYLLFNEKKRKLIQIIYNHQITHQTSKGICPLNGSLITSNSWHIQTKIWGMSIFSKFYIFFWKKIQIK